MAGPSLAALARILVNEDGLSQELAQTETAKDLQGVRKDLAKHIQGVAKSGDLSLIIATEKAIVDGDLKRYANSSDMAKSLGTALNELGVIENHLRLIADHARYATVNEAHSLPKNRRGGVPYDEARQAMASHYTRLGNMDKSRLTADEKAVIDARKDGLKTGRKLYETMQVKAVGIDPPTKRRERGAEL